MLSGDLRPTETPHGQLGGEGERQQLIFKILNKQGAAEKVSSAELLFLSLCSSVCGKI